MIGSDNEALRKIVAVSASSQADEIGMADWGGGESVSMDG